MDVEDLSREMFSGYVGRVVPDHSQGRPMSEFVYRGEAHKICKVNIKTWDKYVKSGFIKPDGKDPLGHIYFRRDKVIQFAKNLAKKRKPGLPIYFPKRP
jgi:hypothetical protein